VTFWIVLVALCLVALIFAVWPLWRSAHKLTPLLATVIVFTVGTAAVMYDQIGSPGVPSGRSGQDDVQGMDEAIRSLEDRLEDNPDDLNGWKMLARTHMALKNYGRAADTLEHVMQMESAQNAQTMVDLALAILSRDQAPIQGRTASLVESALALEPNNQAALFYSGIAAANRGETDKAAMLWEKLLGLNPPDDVRDIVVRNIAFWRGEEVPEPVAEVSEPVSVEPESIPGDAIISARVSLSNDAMSAIASDTNVFIIARDPNQPSPPIAVTRRRVSELPALVSLSDSQSMVAGRNLSMFAEIELLARVSLSGGPAAASGDWFGSMIVRPAETDSVSLTIDQQVP
jgi:cytochrome c-type biogenesis protein CcmH